MCEEFIGGLLCFLSGTLKEKRDGNEATHGFHAYYLEHV